VNIGNKRIKQARNKNILLKRNKETVQIQKKEWDKKKTPTRKQIKNKNDGMPLDLILFLLLSFEYCRMIIKNL